MNAESVEENAEGIWASVDSLPEWVFPPPGGFTADHFLRMRDLPRRTELIDGAIVFAAPQSMWHSDLKGRLVEELRGQIPEEVRALQGMTVKLGERQAPEPDVMIVPFEIDLAAIDARW